MRYALILLILFTSNMLNAVEKFPVDHFFKDPSMLDPQLSPDGNYLAALLPYNINEEMQKICERRTQDFLKNLEIFPFGFKIPTLKIPKPKEMIFKVKQNNINPALPDRDSLQKAHQLIHHRGYRPSWRPLAGVPSPKS